MRPMRRRIGAVLATATLLPAWFGNATADEPQVENSLSIWNGIYTSAQAERGAAIYGEPCGKCHGRGLDGAPDDPDMFSTPPVGGRKFLRDWDGTTLLGLFEYTRTTMPANNPGSLDADELADVIAYMLSASGVPAGTRELVPDRATLAAIAISTAP